MAKTKGKVPYKVAGGLAGPGSLYSEERSLAREGNPRNARSNNSSDNAFKKGSLPTMSGQVSGMKKRGKRGSTLFRPPKVKF